LDSLLASEASPTARAHPAEFIAKDERHGKREEHPCQPMAVDVPSPEHLGGKYLIPQQAALPA
jgi:hypothetical protein